MPKKIQKKAKWIEESIKLPSYQNLQMVKQFQQTLLRKEKSFKRIIKPRRRKARMKDELNKKLISFTLQFLIQALRLFGCDFGLISTFLKKRSRKQIKNKYKKEYKENQAKVQYATSNRIEISPEELEKYLENL